MVQHLLWVLLLLQGAAAAVVPAAAKVEAVKSAPKWLTLSGDVPAVIARGGYSGLFPESSGYAYEFALSTSLPDVVLFCDLQLTKDGGGICRSELRLDNSTNIQQVFPRGDKTYNVNGERLSGWFTLDYTADQLLNNVTLIQNIFSRPSEFDGSQPMSMVEDVAALRPPKFWLNVQYNMFFREHNLDATAYILMASEQTTFDYISSPEISFLKGLNGKVKGGKTKLIFRFLDIDAVEPSTKTKYGTLVKDLASIKSFASGILVPKNYIWPVNTDRYLEAHTSLVADAHKLGLEVYASDFANDLPASYNYSYDPTAEYLQFIDNPDFSVDGVLTDFPSTASEAIACLAHTKNNTAPKGRPLIITRNGASGVYAGSTDLAYQQAIQDGADIIDCSVQMSNDGVAFCLDSADLMGDTTAVTLFMSRSTMVPEIQPNSGIFSFDLMWSEIQSLKPSLSSPFEDSQLERNPAAKNDGKFMTLPEFLNFAKNSTVSGILISIENAAYLASKKNLDLVNAVSTALANASFDKQTTQKVLIQSDDTSVLSKFKKDSYERVLMIKETISGAPDATVDEIKQFADAVNIPRSSLVSVSGFYLSQFTGVAKNFQAANISVYVSVLRNEFVTLAFDFLSDPMMEIVTYIAGVGVDGVITEFPATTSAYIRSPCFDQNANLPYNILPAEPGKLSELVPPEALPPAEAPAPVLKAADVVDPPLPPLNDVADAEAPVATPTASPPPPSGQPAKSVNVALCFLMVVLSLMSLIYH